MGMSFVCAFIEGGLNDMQRHIILLGEGFEVYLTEAEDIKKRWQEYTEELYFMICTS